ncbi:MAG TPA: PQQ-dependent sugar dehydrogenase [Bryobacteraceae bacterium]|nr:PQQ-dependent sugar dehydrogenase [Bryobacteraceae bacterium]
MSGHLDGMRLASLLLLSCALMVGQTPNVRLHRVLTGLDLPTDIQTSRDGSGRLFVVEQRGLIRIVKNGSLVQTPFLDFRTKVSCCGERGLLGLAFPPEFTSKRYFYVNYTDPRGTTTVSRVRVAAGNSDTADPASEQVLLSIEQPFANHNGGALVFGPKDGMLYIGTGDGGSGNDPNNSGQRTDTLLGKMLRIDVESGSAPYSVPPSNPFVNNTSYRPEIWATGLRNPWRYDFDRETGDLWIADVGQSRAEEVNFQPGTSRGGENYGWRLMEGLQCNIPANCDRQGLTLPVLEYPRSAGCSVTGGKVYRGKRWPDLAGSFLYADFCTGTVWGVKRTAAAVENRTLAANTQLPITTFGEDENGELFIGAQNGSMYLLVAGDASTTAQGIVNGASFGPGLAPGSLATVFGNGITTFAGVLQAQQFPLPTDLGGSSVTINGAAVPLIAVASSATNEQINFQLPFDIAPGSTATVMVRANGQSAPGVQIPIVAAQPEIFLVGNGVPAVTSATTGSLISQANPAARGSIVSIWATGLGTVTNTPATGQPASANPLSFVSAPVEVRIGNALSPNVVAVLAPNYAGLYQINATIPSDTPAGQVDLTLTTRGATSKAVTTWVR